MLRRLFRSRDRLFDADPKVRREAVLALDAARARAETQRLAKLLAEDPDRSVRLAVIERLAAIDLLTGALDDDAVSEAAARRIAALARATGGPLPDHPRLREIGLLQASPAERLERIAAIDDPEQLIALALRDRGSLRTAVLEHPVLQTAAALSLLEKRSRGADKSLNRHAREALDGIRRLQHQAAEARGRVEELVAALHRAATLSDQAAWDREQQLYQQCVSALAGYDDARAALARFGEALPTLQELRRQIVPPVPKVSQPEPSGADPSSSEQLPGAARAATTASAPEREEAQPTTARPEAESSPQSPSAVAELPAAERFDDAPVVDAERTAAAAAERAARQAAAAAREAEFDAVDVLLQAGEHALDAGQIASARQQLAEARQRLQAVEGEPPRRLTRRLSRLGAALAELRDWQTFVTSPKRESLCAALQALVDRPLAPADQAERLRALRAEWRELGPATRKSDVELMERFNALAEQAFEPCRAYFAEQAEARSANLVAREQICEQLTRYLGETDWSRADMKAAEQILRTAREAWRQHSPVDRKAGRAAEMRFEELQNALHAHLKAFWDGNGEAKRRIVAEAQSLATEDGDLDDRIRRVKDLQLSWRSIGPTQPRGHDQALWSEFRTACDALFTARDHARSAAQTELQRLAGQCAAALDDFESQLAALTPETATEAQARTLRERLQPVDGLPPPLRRPLAARRSELLERHRTLLRDQDRATHHRRIAELRERDERFSREEVAHRDGAPAPLVPERCFAPRLGRHADPVPVEALRRLAVQAEQAAGIANPAEDEGLRLEVQVERLRGGLRGTEDESPLALAERWCSLGPKDASVDALRARFFAALEARRVP